MPTWTNTPPPDAAGPSLPLLRTPPARTLVAISTTDDLLGTYTHFWHGHTVPCNRPDCEACSDSIPYRWHAYLAAYRGLDALHFLFEMTAQAAEAFVTFRKAHGTLRGCLFESRRHNNRPNGRLVIRTKPADLTNLVLPRPPDLTKVLAILWNLPALDVTESGTDSQRDVPNILAKRGNNAQNSPPKATETYDQTTQNARQLMSELHRTPPIEFQPNTLVPITDPTTGRKVLGQPEPQKPQPSAPEAT